MQGLWYILKKNEVEPVKKTDILLIVIVLLMAGVLYFSGALRPTKTGGEAVIFVDGQEYKRLPLNQDTTVTVEVDGHINVVEIKDGYANMTEANCPDKLCVRQKKIHLEHETIVCLPNKVIVEIQNGTENDVDSVAQ